MFGLFKRKNKELKIGFCKKCGRIIFNKESIYRGYGQNCYKIIQNKKSEDEMMQPLFEQNNNGIFNYFNLKE